MADFQNAKIRIKSGITRKTHALSVTPVHRPTACNDNMSAECHTLPFGTQLATNKSDLANKSAKTK